MFPAKCCWSERLPVDVEMEINDLRAEWGDEEPVVKEEIASDNENADDCNVGSELTDSELGQGYANDDCSFFLKEDISNFEFKEEIDDQERDKLSFHDESCDFESESVKIEQTADEIVVFEDPMNTSVYLDESDEVLYMKDIEKTRKRKNRYSRFNSICSLFLNGNQTTTPESTTHQDDNNHPQFTDVNNRNRYACSTCRRYYKSQAALKTHLKEHESDEKRSFECAICSSKFSHKRNLGAHIFRQHMDKNRFSCQVCYKTFLKKSTLIQHGRLHATEAPYKCEECNKSFSEKWNFYHHKKLHSTQRPFVCHVCNMNFKFKGILKTHMLVHLDDKCRIQVAFNCTMCSQTFPRKNQLKKHIRDHAYQQYKFALLPGSS